jgi:hypothetical protein
MVRVGELFESVEQGCPFAQFNCRGATIAASGATLSTNRACRPGPVRGKYLSRTKPHRETMRSETTDHEIEAFRGKGQRLSVGVGVVILAKRRLAASFLVSSSISSVPSVTVTSAI